MNGQRIIGAGVVGGWHMMRKGGWQVKRGSIACSACLAACALALAAGTQACRAVAVVADLY